MRVIVSSEVKLVIAAVIDELPGEVFPYRSFGGKIDREDHVKRVASVE